MNKWIIEWYSVALWRVRRLDNDYTAFIGSHQECRAWVRKEGW
jgi:hypothetical protein